MDALCPKGLDADADWVVVLGDEAVELISILISEGGE
jgi:hypothetical protein